MGSPWWDRERKLNPDRKQRLLTFLDDIVFGFSLALVVIAILVVLFIACQMQGQDVKSIAPSPQAQQVQQVPTKLEPAHVPARQFIVRSVMDRDHGNVMVLNPIRPLQIGAVYESGDRAITRGTLLTCKARDRLRLYGAHDTGVETVLDCGNGTILAIRYLYIDSEYGPD